MGERVEEERRWEGTQGMKEGKPTAGGGPKAMVDSFKLRGRHFQRETMRSRTRRGEIEIQN